MKALKLNVVERHWLADALLGFEGSETSPSTPYDPNNIVPLLERIVASGCTVAREEIAFLLTMQEQLPHILSANLIRALLEERRTTVEGENKQ